jgi:hypothetical protein
MNTIFTWLGQRKPDKGKPGALKKSFQCRPILFSPQIFIKEEGKFFSHRLLFSTARSDFKINCYDHSDGKLLDVGV